LELASGPGELSAREQALQFIAEHGGEEVDSYEGIDQDALRRAYRCAAAKLHPDTGGDPEEFKKLQRARDLLQGAES